MRNEIRAAVVVGAMLVSGGGAAFGQTSMGSMGSATSSAAGSMTGATGSAAQDKMFLMKASEGSLAEIDMSKLALQKSKNDDVKQIAQRMIDDHTKLMADTKPFADQMGVPPPTKLSPSHMQEAARLKGLSGTAFDKEYLTAMVGDHHKTLGDFQAEIGATQNDQLKTTLQQGEQVIVAHTEMIDGVAQKMGIATPPMPTSAM